MAALAASLPTLEAGFILPPHFTVDGRPEIVARETRRNLGGVIDKLSDEEIDTIAANAEAHRQSGQRVFLEVAYGEAIGTTDATLLFKKSGTDITAVYTFYKDEEEGRDKRLLRELKRMEYLEKVIMPMLATTDRNNSIGVVQGMIRSSSAFVKGLQSVFKQVETLSKAIERGLQNKSEMPTAEQKTAAIQSIQTTLNNLKPSAVNHLSIKNMVQQQVDALLKNVASPVTTQRITISADTKSTVTPITTAAPKNNTTTTPAVTAPRAATPSTEQPTLRATVQPTIKSTFQANLQTRVQQATRPITSLAASTIPSARVSVLTNPTIAERVHAQVATQQLAAKATVAATTQPLAQPVSVAVTSPVSLRIIATNPQLQRIAAPATRSAFTVIDSIAGQQVLGTLARNAPANATLNTAANIQVVKVDAARPASVAQPTIVQSVNTQPVAAQPVSQPIATQPIVVHPVAQQTVIQATTAQSIGVQPVVVQPTSSIVTGTLPAAPQEQPRASVVTSTTTPQRPDAKQDAPRTDEPTEPKGTKSILGKAEPEKDNKKTDFKANAKSACEACTTKDCANCGVKTSTLFGVKTNTIPILRHIPEAALQKATKMFGINAGKCAGCAGGDCASCGAARVTADTAKVSSRFANLNKTAPQPTPK